MSEKKKRESTPAFVCELPLQTTPADERDLAIRLAFGRVAQIMQQEAPTLFGDFTETPLHDGTSQWIP